jgi:integrase
MRSLRTILSKLLPREEVLASFSNVYTGRAATDKRSVDRETVSKVKNLQLKERSALSLARDIFLFCFYALGMPFVDVAFLRRQQVNGDQIVYYRRKTGTRVTVPLLPCMRDIIGRYQNNTSDYVFPLLGSTDPQTAYNEYLTKLNWYNRALKRLARRAGVSETLTSYTTRHTWATTAYHNCVELPVISKALGHSSPQTTLTYLREINDHRLMEANSRIVQLV